MQISANAWPASSPPSARIPKSKIRASCTELSRTRKSAADEATRSRSCRRALIQLVFHRGRTGPAVLESLSFDVIGKIPWLESQADGPLAAFARLDFVHREGARVAVIVRVLPFPLFIEGEHDQHLEVGDSLLPFADQLDVAIPQVARPDKKPGRANRGRWESSPPRASPAPPACRTLPSLQSCAGPAPRAAGRLCPEIALVPNDPRRPPAFLIPAGRIWPASAMGSTDGIHPRR